MSEGSRFLDFARNDKTQNFLLRYFHRAEVYFPIECLAGTVRLCGGADWPFGGCTGRGSECVASPEQDCFAQSSITSEMRWLSC